MDICSTGVRKFTPQEQKIVDSLIIPVKVTNDTISPEKINVNVGELFMDEETLEYLIDDVRYCCGGG